MKLILTVILTAVLAACVTASKIDTGEQTVGERLLVTLEGPWNQVNISTMEPAKVWTMEGLPLDQLLIYSGVKNDEKVSGSAPAGAARKDFVFRSAMQPDEVVTMFEGMLTRDGSQFKLVKLEPASFGGEKGFRFEYSIVRRGDNAQLSGVGFGAVSKGELFSLLYHAPRLTFFPRHQPRVERMARSARLKT
jgi:hypothetical protein